jgi:predicted AlkP superfamily pyrophosphatase or phosphodiesterase
MKRLLIWQVAGLALLALAACAEKPRQTGPTVVVVCVEALRHDYPDRVSAPTLSRMGAEGARADRVVPVFPTNSLPNQAAIATGLPPAASGIVNNRFWDRRQRRTFEGEPDEFEAMLLAEPIWITAERQGVPTAVLNWGGAEIDYDGVVPSHQSGLNEKASDEQRIDQVVRWLADTSAGGPRLILAYLDGLDDVSHKQGPDAEATLRTAERYDALVGRVLEAMLRHRGQHSATLFVLGDHGMAHVTRCVYLKAFLARRGIAARPFATGGSANVYLPPGEDAREVKQLLAGDTQLFAAYLPEELASRYGYYSPDRGGDLVLIGRPGTYLRDREGQDNPVGRARLPGMHGFPPEEPSMMTALLAWGRGVPAGTRWEQVSLLDLYPTVCSLLDVDPAGGFAGRVLPGIQPEGSMAQGSTP